MMGSGALRIVAMLLSGTSISADVSYGPAGLPALEDQAQAAPSAPDASPQPDQEQQISQLAALLIAALQTKGLQRGQIEGQLSLAIGQSQAACGVSQSALTRAAAQVGQLSPDAAVAVRNITGALARCEVNGTAALANAQTLVEQGTTLGLSGGSSNYTSQ
ncbi:hypothetical protein [Sphingomonas sp. PAMC 26617]|uniref:hypothetical protein n=1 Tax=Sphingomonas sp. PAMC 26617 TaxID=1112216 RepID=UPI0002E525F3|nr:hypothetical protein [Sphingomonas sp. PAMC 26617]